MTRLGMDVEVVERQGRALQREADRIKQLTDEVDRLVRTLNGTWFGRQASRFSGEQWPQSRALLRHAGEAVSGLGQSALNNAREQRQTSSASGSSTAAAVGLAAASAALGGLPCPDIPRTGTAATNATWWNGLDRRQQAYLIALAPAALGNLDGIPAQVRDQVNRNRIETERRALKAEKARIEKALDHDAYPNRWTPFNDEGRLLQVLQGKLDALDAIDAVKNGEPPRQVLLLDLTQERAMAAVSVGNVDTAAHVAVMTPGLTSSVERSLNGMVGDAVNLTASAAAASDGDVAVIAWIGYQAPQAHSLPEVALRHSAEAGAHSLSGFLSGIKEARADDPHLVALGHSYGSTVTGLALQQTAPGVVDDVVFMGSPGIGTNDLSDLNVPSGRAFVMEGDADPVANLARFGTDPNLLPGIINLSTRDSSQGFGVPLLPTIQSPFGTHEGYYTAGSTSQHNLAMVVAGEREATVGTDALNPGSVVRSLYEPQLAPGLRTLDMIDLLDVRPLKP